MNYLNIIALTIAISGSYGSHAQSKVNFAILPATVTAGFMQAPGPQGPTDEEKEKARIKIGITKDQQAKIDALYKEMDDLRKEIRNSMRDKQIALWKVYDEYKVDETLALKLREEIVVMHRKMAEIHAEHEQKLRKVLNKDQFMRLRAMMKEMFEKMRSERSKGGHGGPGRPGGGPFSP